MRRSRRSGSLLVVALALAAHAQAGPREQAKRLHDRLVGVPPSEPVLAALAGRIANGDPLGAAYQAMEHPVFYSSSLKNFATPWTNVERSVFAPLNDYTATVIGMVRDDVPFNRVLSADLVYVGAPGVVPTPYSPTSNEHYEELEAFRVDLSDPALFVATAQSSLPGAQLLPAETAGVITTRAAGEAFFSAGTNRRMMRFLAIHYLCRDLEELMDNALPADRIRQDVSRSPGGDSQLFFNQCAGCHTGLDPLSGAFAYFDFDLAAGRVVYTRGEVQPKNLINANTFPGGYVTVDDRWDNYWRQGANAALGWRGNTAGGFGVKSLGEEIAASRAFSLCQVRKVFAHVCFRPPNSPEDVAEVQRVADVFETSDYSLKRVFAEIGVFCMGN